MIGARQLPVQGKVLFDDAGAIVTAASDTSLPKTWSE